MEFCTLLLFYITTAALGCALHFDASFAPAFGMVSIITLFLQVIFHWGLIDLSILTAKVDTYNPLIKILSSLVLSLIAAPLLFFAGLDGITAYWITGGAASFIALVLYIKAMQDFGYYQFAPN